MVETYDGVYIDGTWRDLDHHLESEFPFTGDSWARFPRADAEIVDDAVTAAREALAGEWGDLSPVDRAELLERLARCLDDRADEIAHAETLDNGKPLRETRAMASAIPDWFQFFAAVCRTLDERALHPPGKNAFVYTQHDPVGVAAMITPYNSPLMLGTWKLAPALAAGASVVLKPSKLTPISSLTFARCVEDAGFPPGAVNVVTGTGSEVGEALVNHDGVDKISFTGGTDVGRTIAAEAGNNIVPLTLELGGKSANIVFDDARLENAINGAVPGMFKAAGQSCTAGSRLLAHESLYDDLVAGIVEQARAIRLGDPRDLETEMGPITTEEQLEKIESLVASAREEGATLECGGNRVSVDGCDRFFEPTVFGDVTREMSIANEEVFGPVLSVIPFDGDDTAIEIANQTRYGLAAGLWTENYRRAHRVASELDVGRVWVNMYKASSFAAPQGGRNDSGYGIENGIEAIEEYANPKSIWMNLDETVEPSYSESVTR